MNRERHKWIGPVRTGLVPNQGPNGSPDGTTRRLFFYVCDVCGKEQMRSRACQPNRRRKRYA